MQSGHELDHTVPKTPAGRILVEYRGKIIRGRHKVLDVLLKEGVYYPLPWHINTRVRKALLFSRYHVATTVFMMRRRFEMVIKAWVSADIEYHHEVTAYKMLHECLGMPATLYCVQYDPLCDVYALLMQKVGPSLQDLISALPERCLDMRMVLTIAIQMIERYLDIHGHGLIDSGTKSGNICLAPRSAQHFRRAERYLDIHGRGLIDSGTKPGNICLAPRSAQHFRRAKEKQQQKQQQEQSLQLQVLRLKIAPPAPRLFNGMDECFHGFWCDVKALGYGEIPDYEKMRGRFVLCLEKHEKGCAPPRCGWWDLWDQFNS
ncbi:hypothetical protein K438DRAFT_2140863 [Mycena galopus ATCC 62051]|nr:hypothetical protein K438DRAFT_2140863 [Mycena galopus ATCC 62051]